MLIQWYGEKYLTEIKKEIYQLLSFQHPKNIHEIIVLKWTASEGTKYYEKIFVHLQCGLISGLVK